jgi:broad specificity phosphatase PhoE
VSVVLLVRHGQASFGKRNYDALSERGHEQARILGAALAARGVVPDLMVRGDMRRHRETVEGILEGLGSGEVPREVPIEVDAGWDEFDFKHVVAVHRPLYRSHLLMMADVARTPAADRRRRFGAIFEEATARWTGGSADGDYHESFAEFGGRVDSALRRTAALGAEREARTVLVVSSGGPIGMVASHLVAGDASLWATLNRVAVNTAVTKVIAGTDKVTLSTYNEHSHLEHDRSLITSL